MKTVQQASKIAHRRYKKRAAHEHQRKLKRKLCHIVDELYYGRYQGVKSSPLLRVNKQLTMSMLKKRWGN